jgi:hypothetical protein
VFYSPKQRFYFSGAGAVLQDKKEDDKKHGKKDEKKDEKKSSHASHASHAARGRAAGAAGGAAAAATAVMDKARPPPPTHTAERRHSLDTQRLFVLFGPSRVASRVKGTPPTEPVCCSVFMRLLN